MNRRPSRSKPPRAMVFLTHRAIGPILLIALVFIVYANSLHGEFVFDDRLVIFGNAQLLNIKAVADVFQFGDWRAPLYVTYRLNSYLGGTDPWGYHVLSVTLHALNMIL